MIKSMSGEKTKIDTLTEVEQKEKAKVAIVRVINNMPSILVLTRSELEDTRVGQGDWAGGSLDDGEKPVEGLVREVGEELPGVELQNITKLTVRRKMRDGVRVVSHLYAATAELPPDGIELSAEHDAYAWIPFDEFPDVDIPNKYRKAVASESGRMVLDELAELSLQEPVPLAA
jgi:8-oxo-dGTP pyrophosphatase MutT (NUDIX family)